MSDNDERAPKIMDYGDAGTVAGLFVLEEPHRKIKIATRFEPR